MGESLINSFINLNNQSIHNQSQFFKTNHRQRYLSTLKSLLMQINTSYFSSLLYKQQQLEDLEQIICQYYSKQLHIQKKPKIRLNKILQYQYMFKLAFGLAIKLNQEKYICNIMNLDKNDQEILLPFIKQLIQGQQSKDQQMELKKQQQELMKQVELKQTEISILKQRHEILSEKFNDIYEELCNSKQQIQQLRQELSQLKLQKEAMLSELTVNNYEDFMIRFKKIQESYEASLQTIQKYKQIEAQLHSQNDNLKLILNQNIIQLQKKNQEINHQYTQNKTKITEISDKMDAKDLESLKFKNIKLYESSKYLEKKLTKLKEENQKIKQKQEHKKKKLNKLKKIANNYQQIKNLSKQLKKTISVIMLQ